MINKKNIANKKTVSKTNDKRSELLIKVDGLLEKLDNDYGPFLLGALNKRLEKTIEDFNKDLKNVLEDSFNSYNNKREEFKNLSEANDQKSTPSFIAEYENKVKSNK